MRIQRFSGLKAYRWQRLSAYGLMIYLPLTLLYFYQQSITSYPQLIHTLSQPLFLIPTLGIMVLLLIHSWVGVRDILMDYLPKFLGPAWLSPALTLWGAILLLTAADLLYLTLKVLIEASQ